MHSDPQPFVLRLGLVDTEVCFQSPSYMIHSGAMFHRAASALAHARSRINNVCRGFATQNPLLSCFVGCAGAGSRASNGHQYGGRSTEHAGQHTVHPAYRAPGGPRACCDPFVRSDSKHISCPCGDPESIKCNPAPDDPIRHACSVPGNTSQCVCVPKRHEPDKPHILPDR